MGKTQPPSPVAPSLDPFGVADEWRQQAERDLGVATYLADGGFHEWACYAAQQAAEKAIKAVRHALAIDLHDDSKLSHDLNKLAAPLYTLWPAIFPPNIKADLITLTQHEADGRYPGLRSGSYLAPANPAIYSRATATKAVGVAESVVKRCSVLLGDLRSTWPSFWSKRPKWP